MSEPRPNGGETLNEKTFLPCMAWLTTASMGVTAVLPATNHEGWTDIAPLIPQAFVAGLAAYAWALIRWIRWGERRRASGRGSLFGSNSRIGVTASSHSLLFQTVAGGAICVLGGYATAHLFNGTFGIILYPGLAIGVPTVFEHGEISVIYRCAAWIAYPQLVLCGILLRQYGFSPVTGTIALALVLLAVSLLTWMVRAHAREPWPAEHPTESKTP